MDYVRLGSTGLKVSRLCVGTMTYRTSKWRPWVLDEDTSRPFIKRALELGINFFDTASMYVWQFANMLATQRQNGWARFVSMQNHYNLIYREEEREMIPLCRAEGIGLIPWSPLARGFLAGNRKRDSKDATIREQHDHYGHSLYYALEDYDIADRVVALAERKGVLPIQIALAWVVSQPGVTAPIVA